jgi:hypothetical protein
MSDKQIKFYQNNPCVIIRDINDDFCEIQLNVHFATNIESEYYCTPSEFISPTGGGERYQDEYDQAQAIIDDIQDEKNSIICMVEKRLLHDKPVEATTIDSLQRKIDEQKLEFQQTKELHEEWRQSKKSLEKSVEALKEEINSLELSREAADNMLKTSRNGINKLQEKHNKIIIEIGCGNQKITMHEYQELLKRDKKLTALERGGVDNWEWYEESLKEFKE